MTREEFEKLTGLYPSQTFYAQIEATYMVSSMDKQTFCKAFMENKDGLAEKIQRTADMLAFDAYKRAEDQKKKEIEVFKKERESLEAEIERFKKLLDIELEWKPYEIEGAITQKKYVHLKEKGDTKKLSDEKAKDLLYDLFGFAKEKLVVLHDAPVYEINRHGRLRKCKTTERIPLYNATDWYYIRFTCAGVLYEVYNNQVRLIPR